MTRTTLAAVIALLAAPVADAQQILSQKRTVYAAATTYEPFYDNITYTDSDSDSTTAAGAWNRTVEAYTNFLNTDYGTAGARQTTTINTAAKSFSGDGATTAQAQLYYGADSTGYGETMFEVTFKLNRRGGVTLSGSINADGWTYYPEDAEFITAVYTNLKIVNTATGAVVFERVATLANPNVALDNTVNLPKGTYKLVVTSVSEASTYPNPDNLYVYDPNTYFNVSGQVFHR